MGRAKDSAAPAGWNWNLWLGSAPPVRFNRSRLEYSWWFGCGGGMMTNWAVHHLDLILWAMRVRHYRGYNSFHHLQSRPNDHGIAFHGSQATLVLDRSGYEVWAEGNAKDRAEVVAVEESYFPGIVNRGEQDGAWHRTFLDCARDRKSPPLPFELSHEATACCLLGNISYLTGHKIRWDGERGRILGDDIAMGMLDTPLRPGWDLPQI